MKRGCLVLLIGFGLGMPALAADEPAQRHHAYAFDHPELLATQRTFGVGNAVTLLGEACVDDPKAAESYGQWGEVNQEVLSQMTTALAAHYRIATDTPDLQDKVADAMHLKTALVLTGSALTEACTTLPETLALPSMNLEKRYQAVLREVKHPDYLKKKRLPAPAADTQPQPVENSHDREEQTRSE